MKKSLMERIDDRLNAIKAMAPQDFDLVPPRGRLDQRIPTHMFALAITEDGREYKCIVENLSRSGAGISSTDIEILPENFLLAIDGYDAPTHVRLVWRDGGVGGLEFLRIVKN